MISADSTTVSASPTVLDGRGTRNRRGGLVARALVRGALAVVVPLACGIVIAMYSAPAAAQSFTVVAYNELGMHCMNQDFSEMMILPPYNTLRAQVIQRGGEPRIVTSGVTIRYRLPGNTRSATKTNFWEYSQRLFGTAIPPDTGLTGNRLSGVMIRTPGQSDWEATGIPVTPVGDTGRENPYPLATVTVERGGAVVAATQAVVPVSWEISCNLCHNTAGVSTAQDILRAHDRLHGTHLTASTPVNCSQCHADPVLGSAGTAGVPTLSSAMHRAHASRMSALPNLEVACYACHPGVQTKCQRDVHLDRGMTCTSCHGTMRDVGNPSRQPWTDLPRCGTCHQARRPTFAFEQPGVLFRNAVGHHGVKCVTCHNSPHATTPTTTAIDNLQAKRLQGHSGTIDTCTVCHTSHPEEAFNHTASGD